jgi:hypothetical protein
LWAQSCLDRLQQLLWSEGLTQIRAKACGKHTLIGNSGPKGTHRYYWCVAADFRTESANALQKLKSISIRQSDI